MSAANEEILTDPVKSWDAFTINVSPNDNFIRWRFTDKGYAEAIKLIKKIEPGIGDQYSNISFIHFRSLVKFLHDNGCDTKNVDTAIDQYKAKQATGIEKTPNLDKEIQLKLRSLFSPNTPGPFTIIADGKWGPASQRALDHVRRVHPFIPEKPNEELLRCLDTISQKIVRIKCTDDYLLTHTDHNPFCIIDNNAEELELRHKGNGASLFEQPVNKELAHFHSFLAADKRDNESFTKFSAWLMFLKMKSMNYQKVVDLSILKNESWIPIEELEQKSTNEFLLNPEHYLDLNDLKAKCQVSFSSSTEEQIDVFGIYFSGDFRIAYTTGYLTGPDDSNATERIFDAEYFFKDLNYINNERSPATSLYRADYLKIFVARKGIFNDIPKEFSHTSLPGVDLDLHLHKLITTPQSDIYKTYTIGLNFPANEIKPNQAAAFKNKWVLVAGTGGRELDKKETELCKLLGESLAENGYGVICGGWPGVDEAVSRYFVNKLEQPGIEPNDRLIQLLEKNQKPAFHLGKKNILENKKDWYTEAVTRAFALVMIGGEGGTYKTYQEARKYKIPVIPLPGTGNDAARAFRQMSSDKSNMFSSSYLTLLELEKDDIHKTAEFVSLILDELLNAPVKKMSPAEFKAYVQTIYEQKPTIDRDDLQKERWGSKAENNGKILTANVTSGKDGFFKVELFVRSTNSESLLEGNVAFFVHNSFEKEIQFATAKNGEAKIELIAFEAFTVGAYTEDHTILELDLQQMPELPEKFYYIEPSENFKIKVENLYASLKVNVADDLQKGRWGGKNINKNKSLQAQVKKNLMPGLFDIILTVKSESQKLLTGQVAFFLHSSFNEEIRYQTVENGQAQIKITAYETFTAGAYTEDGTMLELDLQEQKGYPQGFYYKKISQNFKDTVSRLYKSKPVTVKDDLQKNRWGGKSLSNGKKITASVIKGWTPGYFKITIEITSENSKSSLQGDVAFFIHDTFKNEIKYKKAINGIAKINVTAYEAFTIGAYTEDGTMLELDLQKQEGYPKGFYYPKEKQKKESTRISPKPRRK